MEPLLSRLFRFDEMGRYLGPIARADDTRDRILTGRWARGQ